MGLLDGVIRGSELKLDLKIKKKLRKPWVQHQKKEKGSKQRKGGKDRVTGGRGGEEISLLQS